MPTRCRLVCLLLPAFFALPACFAPAKDVPVGDDDDGDDEDDDEDEDDEGENDGEPPSEEGGDETNESCPVDCGAGVCCGADTVCVADGCCPEETPFYCGAQLCATSEMHCPYYSGPCIGNSECMMNEVCLGWESGDTFCAPSCESDADCPQPSDGGAVPTCGESGDSGRRCFLYCDEGDRTCPAGMGCWILPEETVGLCVWNP